VLPSEHQLVGEFGVSRPTIVRALEILRQQGWIDAEQGRGRFVRGRPAVPAPQHERHGSVILNADGFGQDAITIRHVLAPRRVAILLGSESDPMVLMRLWLRSFDGEPVELISAYFPLEIAEGTDLGSDQPIPGGVRQHLEIRKRIRFHHVTETITTRMPTPDESRLLQISGLTPVLCLWVVGRDAATQALEVAEAVLPGDRHELEDTYLLT
jgi:GntR family transcriptional regulator